MTKVIIADDETRICRLIANLVNWDEFGMEIIGLAHNGIDALRLIETKKPQLVITDIRMPGYDGLEMIQKARDLNLDVEFILISGYEEFAYAQKAIEFGVRDYLSKPINKDRLRQALGRIQESIKNRDNQERLAQEYKNVQRDVDKVRSSFLKTFVASPADIVNTSLAEVNQEHYFHFAPGLFRVAWFQVDLHSPSKSSDEEIDEKQVEKVRSDLHDITYDAQVIRMDRNLCMLVNYAQDQKEAVDLFFEKSLRELKSRLSPRGLLITIGCGEDVTDLTAIASSLQGAKAAIDDRIFKGVGQIIVAPKVGKGSNSNQERYFSYHKRLIKAVELLHIEKVKQAIDGLKEEFYLDLRDKQWLSGSELLELMRDIVDTYYITLRNNNVRIIDSNERAEWEAALDNAYSVDVLFQELVKGITSSLSKLSKGDEKRNLEQIRQAKLYIEEHYMGNISLEDLGSHLGFNPSYFSSLFKKETGTSFLEYVVKVRMEKAKELLKEPDLRIQDICLMVGYNDVRHFRKLFTQSTGLSPKEFRRIFA